MEKKLSSKYIHMYMSISRVFIRLTGNVLKLFPFAMVICPVVWFLDWPPESPDNQYHLNK